jgi:subtilisin family serine protease
MRNQWIYCLLTGIAISSCSKPKEEIVFNSLGVDEKNLIEGSYIIDLREDKFIPILSEFDKADFLKDSDKQEKIEKEKKEAIQNFASKYGFSVDPEKFLIYSTSGFVLEGVKNEDLRRLSEDKEHVMAVHQDFTIQDIRARMQNIGPIPQDIRARMQEAWGYSATGFSSKAVLYVGGGVNPVNTNRKIWIIDSGIDSTHQDLKGQFTSGLDASWVASSTEEKNPFMDYIGHGTHCAGIAAAKAYNQTQPNNDSLIGMNGVSPGAQLVSLKIFGNDRTARWQWLRLALDHVAAKCQRGDVVSLSLGAFVQTASSCGSVGGIKSALGQLQNEAFVVMAAGNGIDGVGVNVDTFQPGCVDGLTGIYTIGSIRMDFEYPTNPNAFSVFSNFGSALDWVAPGELIFSTYPSNRYAISTGTSASTAMVAGIIHANGGAPGELATVVGPPGNSSYKISKRNP